MKKHLLLLLAAAFFSAVIPFTASAQNLHPGPDTAAIFRNPMRETGGSRLVPPSGAEEYFGVNLLQNPGAEAKGEQLPGWNVLPDLSWREEFDYLPAKKGWSFPAGSYRQTKPEWKKGRTPKGGLPPGSGEAFFRLPLDSSRRSLGIYQVIDLTHLAGTLQQRIVYARKGGYFAGAFCQNGCTVSRLQESYYDREGSLICGYSCEVSNKEFSPHLSPGPHLLQYAEEGSLESIPPSAARVVLSLTAQSRGCCMETDCFFDNLYYMLSLGELRSSQLPPVISLSSR